MRATDPRPGPATGPTTACCAEYERVAGLSRRGFLAGVAGATGAMAVGQVFGDAVRQATFGAAGGDTLVVLSFRGGVDGMGLVVPHGDPGYAQARPTIGLPTASLLGTDAMFGLHPSLAPLLPLWESGRMAAVHATGMAVPNRSHFEAMELIEDADPASSVRRGWLNRAIGLDASASPTDAVHLGSNTTPTLLAGPSPSLATSRLDRLRMPGTDHDLGPRRYAALDAMWRGSRSPLAGAMRSATDVSRRVGSQLSGVYTPANGASYPQSWPGHDLAAALADTARLITSDLGAKVVSIEFGSWDMHNDYGTTQWGDMQSMARAFAGCVAAFFADLGARADRVTVVTISEFGRRLAENGNRGLDHGWGNAMLVMGGGVKGGYHGTWPGLGGAGTPLADDLSVTTDFRQVLAEVALRRLPEASVAGLFPGLAYAPVGVMRA